jgi:hypothetical protein
LCSTEKKDKKMKIEADWVRKKLKIEADWVRIKEIELG